MSQTKSAFLKMDKLKEQASAVTESDWFRVFMTFARGQLMEKKHVTMENITGAQMLEEIMLDLPREIDPSSGQFPGPGLDHAILQSLPNQPVDESHSS